MTRIMCLFSEDFRLNSVSLIKYKRPQAWETMLTELIAGNDRGFVEMVSVLETWTQN